MESEPPNGEPRSSAETPASENTTAESVRHRREPASSWGAPYALLAAWLVLVPVNAVALRASSSSASPTPVRLVHHLYDAAHLIALGLVTGGLAWAGGRLELSRRSALLATWLAAFGAISFLLREDLANFVQQRAVGPSWLTYGALCAAVATTIPAVWELSRRLARPVLRWVPIVGGIAITTLNHFAFAFSYPGIHLIVAVLAALAIGGVLSTLPRRPVATDRCRYLTRAVTGLVTIAAAASVMVPPSRTVWREMLQSPGTVLAPHLAPLLVNQPGEHQALAVESSPWFSDRSHLPPIPASEPRLAPDGAITIFLTIDALRPDVVPKHPGRFPALERIRREGADFRNARAPSPSTITTISSIFTGKYYSALYWSEIDDKPFKGKFKGAAMPHQDPSPRLAGLLGDGGVDTLHVVPLWGNARELGVGKGFAEEVLTRRDYGTSRDAMTLLLERLEKQDAGPFFAYSHLIDPHAPYNLAGKRGSAYERYLGEVGLVDAALGRLLEFLDTNPAFGERAVLIVSADHGEAFGEHNSKYHAVTIYEEMVRVPLYVRGPGIAPRTVDAPVTLMDLGPTILDLYGQPTPATFMGQSLVGFLRGDDPHLDRPIAIDAGRRMQGLYFPDGKKAIIDIPRRTEEVYDLATDPGELENLVDAQSAGAMSYLGALRTFFDAHEFRREGYETPWRPF